jgi:hypothetical protein
MNTPPYEFIRAIAHAGLKTINHAKPHKSMEISVKNNLLQNLADKSITKQDLLRTLEGDFSILPIIIDGVSSPKATVRYGCASVLMDLSRDHLEKLYPYFSYFEEMLDSRYRILTWNAFAILANLARVDVDRKFDAIFEKYYSFLNNEYMVTVANVVGNSGKIALAKPYLSQRIADELLKVDKISITPHLTEECKRVIAGAAIESFDVFFNQIKNRNEVLEFVKSHLNSPRASLKDKAEKFIKKWDR